ncbi:uncharacterized protein LOC124372541 [Homalodisca vitripennis]|uniref:uncharacterized protein LOC124372541 n=1 Tax=Homalodisca vitripennis TaxID=197043 RepID=UPI001EEAB769|nr:uncharacterized protein LOC124372541 [Homalodisca vitripennis]XP_046686905.1 uncharacterized protein LOC124372541 [Homalodisca vitripennis]XP_046686910.1 uncharacterized protein LOC124372541 [Homalodisca vitripennis]XP_046686915.1 uncharacterized protein LOC124372541 [Homalodisca vitripennis]XP_046686921.1 uncharacterized protein LOC124372541 [Homalodisca vitripennis]
MGGSNSTRSNGGQKNSYDFNQTKQKKRNRFWKQNHSQQNSPRSISPNQYMYTRQDNQVPYQDHGHYSQDREMFQVNSDQNILRQENTNNYFPVDTLIDKETNNEPTSRFEHSIYSSNQMGEFSYQTYQSFFDHIPRSHSVNNIYSGEQFRTPIARSNSENGDFSGIHYKPVVRRHSFNYDYGRPQFDNPLYSSFSDLNNTQNVEQDYFKNNSNYPSYTNNYVPVGSLIDIETYNKPTSRFDNSRYNSEQMNEYNYQNYQHTFDHIPRSHSMNNVYSEEKFKTFITRPNSANGNFSGIRYMRNVVRRHSLNDDYRRLQFGNYHMRSTSIGEVNTTQNVGLDYFRRNSNYSSKSESQFQNFQPRCSFANEAYIKTYQSGIKRNSWDEDDVYGGSGESSGNYPSEADDLTSAGPRVKRRSWDFQESDHYLTGRDDGEYRYSTDITNDTVESELSQGSNEEFDILDILSFPAEWSSCSLGKTGFVDVQSSSAEGRSIQKYFHRTSQSKEFYLTIENVTRIENPFLHSLYLLKKEEMISRNGNVDELFLYHGTKYEHLDNICEDNLNWRLFSEKHKFGQGVSFSPLATYSSHYCDNSAIKVMLLFKVLVSNVVIGTEDMTIPPNDGVTFDTSIKEDASVIVKYSDNEFYPLYKITFMKRLNKPRKS